MNAAAFVQRKKMLIYLVYLGIHCGLNGSQLLRLDYDNDDCVYINSTFFPCVPLEIHRQNKMKFVFKSKIADYSIDLIPIGNRKPSTHITTRERREHTLRSFNWNGRHIFAKLSDNLDFLFSSIFVVIKVSMNKHFSIEWSKTCWMRWPHFQLNKVIFYCFDLFRIHFTFPVCRQ